MRWHHTLSELEAWMSEHGRPPSQRANDAQQGRLAAWLRNQQRNAGPPRRGLHATDDAVSAAWSAHVARHPTSYSAQPPPPHANL